MSRRRSQMLWLKDMLDNLIACQEQLEWTEDEETVHMLTEAMIRDLERCRGLCEALRRPSPLPVAA